MGFVQEPETPSERLLLTLLVPPLIFFFWIADGVRSTVSFLVNKDFRNHRAILNRGRGLATEHYALVLELIELRKRSENTPMEYRDFRRHLARCVEEGVPQRTLCIALQVT